VTHGLRRPVNSAFRSLLGVAAVGVAALGGCAETHVQANGNYVTPIGNSAVTANPTPYSAALFCLADYARRNNLPAPRVAVGKVTDMTGQLDTNGGRPVTQGAQLMAITALGKAGIPLVERYETDPSKLEYGLANNRLIKNSNTHADGDYEPIYPGQIDGAQFFLTGGVTEMNTNIVTDSVGVTGDSLTHSAGATLVGASRYVMNIGIDLRLVNTKSLDIEDIVSYQKQIIGRQVGAGAYSFFGNNVITVNASAGGQEPTHLATRSVIERAVFEIVANLYGMRDTRYCLNPAQDPLSTDVVESSAAAAPPSQVAHR